MEYHKPDIIPRKLDKEKQQAFIENYDSLLNSLADNEAVLFADAVHPTHAARPAGCWAPKQEKLAVEQTSGRERINIHGAIELASGQTRRVGPGNFTLSPSQIPDLILSHHPARATARRLPPSVEYRAHPVTG